MTHNDDKLKQHIERIYSYLAKSPHLVAGGDLCIAETYILAVEALLDCLEGSERTGRYLDFYDTKQFSNETFFTAFARRHSCLLGLISLDNSVAREDANRLYSILEAEFKAHWNAFLEQRIG